MNAGVLHVLMGLDFSQFDRDGALAKRRTEALGGTLSGVLKNAFSFTLGMGFFEAIQVGFKSTISSAVDFNSTMQQAKIGFTTMLGSERRATVFLSDLAKFAAHTPFEMQGLLEATKRMRALGFATEDLLPTLRAVGDAAAALGSGQEGIDSIITGLGQIKTAGKVTSIAMMLLARAGVPSWELLAEAIGKTTGETRQLVEKGIISADVGINALVEGIERRFPGMMKQMEDSWQGVTSTIRDVWRMTLGALTSGLFRSANEWLKRVRDAATGFYDAFQDALQRGGLMYAIEQTSGPQVAAGIQTMSTVLRSLWGVVTGVARTIIANWTIIGPLTLWVARTFLAFQVATLVVRIATGAVRSFTLANLAMHGSLVKGSGLLAFISQMVGTYRLQIHLASVAWRTGGPIAVTWITRIQTALYALNAAIGPIGWAIIAISGLLTAGISLWGKYSAQLQAAAQKAQMDKIVAQQSAYEDAAQKAAAGTNAQADALDNLGKASKDNIQSFDEVHQLMEETADAAGAAGIAGAVPGVPEMPDMPDMSDLFDGLDSAKPSVGGFLEWLWDSVAERLSGLSAWIGNWAVAIPWGRIREGWDAFWAAFAPGAAINWETFRLNAKTTWDMLLADLGVTWGNLKVNAKRVWDELGVDLGRVWNNLRTNASRLWGNLVADAGKAWNDLRLNASKAWSDLGIDLGKLWDDLKTNVGRMWDALKDARWEDLLAAAHKAWDDLGVDLNKAWDALKINARQTWDDLNIDLGKAWDTLKANASKAWSDLGTDLDKAWADLKANAQKAWDDILIGLNNTWGNLRANAGKAWAALVDGIKHYINMLITAINRFIRGFNALEIVVPSINIPFVGKVGGFTVDIPDIPEIPYLTIGAPSTTEGGLSKLAAGGLVTDPTLALLGEAGPEAVVPLGRSGFADDLADSVAQAVFSAVRDALRVTQATQVQGDREIVLSIDGQRFARLLLPPVIKEGQRQGLRLVVQPQGV